MDMTRFVAHEEDTAIPRTQLLSQLHPTQELSSSTVSSPKAIFVKFFAPSVFEAFTQPHDPLGTWPHLSI